MTSPNSNSCVPADFIRSAYENVLGEPCPINEKTGRPAAKNVVAREAVEFAQVADWTDECDFSNKLDYDGHSGDLLKNEGLRRFRDALAHIKEQFGAVDRTQAA